MRTFASCFALELACEEVSSSHIISKQDCFICRTKLINNRFKIGAESMLKSPAINFALLFLTLCFTTPAFPEAEATMHQVYLAAGSLEPELPFAKPEAL
jgi:hypothetical protein